MPIKSVLLGTHVCCLLRDIIGAVLFLSCTWVLRAKLVPRWGNPWLSIQRYASQVLQIRSQCLNPCKYRAVNLIRSSSITLPPATSWRHTHKPLNSRPPVLASSARTAWMPISGAGLIDQQRHQHLPITATATTPPPKPPHLPSQQPATQHKHIN